MTGPADDLSVIFDDQARAVTIGRDRQIQIKPITVGAVRDFTLAVKPIAADVMAAVNGSGDLMLTLELHADRMIDAVSIGAGLPLDEVRGLQLDDFVRLAAAIIEVNTDFFVKRLLPTVKQEVAELQDKVQGGLTVFNA